MQPARRSIWFLSSAFSFGARRAEQQPGRLRSPCFPRSHSRSGREHASVLLEVVLALALFVAAATVISAGINASIQAVERVRLQNHAANLAISLMSELHMGARPVAPFGPESFEPPFQDWLFRIAVDQVESATEAEALRPVEIIVWNPNENVVHRLTQMFRASETSLSESEYAGGGL